MTGMRDFSATRRISPSPPRGMMRSMYSSAWSIQSIASRAVRSTTCTAAPEARARADALAGPCPAPGDAEVDVFLGLEHRADRLPVRPFDDRHGVRGEARKGHRLAEDPRDRGVGENGFGPTQQDDGVPRFDPKGGRVGGGGRAGL